MPFAFPSESAFAFAGIPIKERPDLRIPENYMTEGERLQHTFFFNLMGRNQKSGTFSLNGSNKLQLTFQGRSARFPFWGNGQILNNDPDPARKFVTVHPLGGCVMGTNSSNGVVDVDGKVYNTVAGANAVHENLFIADASVIPGPIAVNPTLTIVAMAQKIAAAIP
jgi:choline dehydrogenase-like flavoprotein